MMPDVVRPPLLWPLGFATVAIVTWDYKPLTTSLWWDLVLFCVVMVAFGLTLTSRPSLHGPSPLAALAFKLAGLAAASAFVIHRFPQPWTLSLVFGVFALLALAPYLAGWVSSILVHIRKR